jgi:hypothetical protein
MTKETPKTAVEKKKAKGKFNGKLYTYEEDLELAEKRLNKILDKIKVLVSSDDKLKEKCEEASK